jgi:hypothetical protein
MLPVIEACDEMRLALGSAARGVMAGLVLATRGRASVVSASTPR